MKQFKELMFRDDFMFGKVMEDNELCRKVLERLLGHPVGKLEAPGSQKEIRVTEDGKPIRLDIYTRDSDTKAIYDAEMQQLGKKSIEELMLPKRSRYYQALIDMDYLSRGNSYKKLTESNVIFICTFDPFGEGRYRYTFEEHCREIDTLYLCDGTRKIFYNTKSTEEDIPQDLKKLFEYINTGIVSDELTGQIEDAVERTRNNSEWGSYYMKTYVHEIDVREDGVEEGLERGREEGTLSTLTLLYQKGFITAEVAANTAGISEKEFLSTIKLQR